jgi:sarcosine oxidase subunit delta
MLVITCAVVRPARPSEFAYGGEAHIARPADPDALTDASGATTSSCARNPRGRHLEQWGHAYGCRRWFNVPRDTVTYAFALVTRPDEPAPFAVRRAGASIRSRTLRFTFTGEPGRPSGRHARLRASRQLA